MARQKVSDQQTTDEYWRILTSINDWIRFSDTKAILTLTSVGVIGTIVYSSATEVYFIMKESTFMLVVSSLTAVAYAGVIAASGISLYPRLKHPSTPSVIYFGDIANCHHSADEYFSKSKFVLTNRELALKQLSSQIYRNSQIATVKFRLVRLAIVEFLVACSLMTVGICNHLIG